MPASSWSALYDFPGNLATAWGAILAADKTTLIGSDTLADPTAFLVGPCANVEMPKDRIEYGAGAFTQASDQQVKSTQNGNWFFAHYAGTLTASVLTPRGATGGNSVTSAAAEHGKRVGRLAYLLAPAAQKFTSSGSSANLPYYELALVTVQTIPSAAPEEDIDVDRTDLVANIELWIRPDAFPATLT